MKDDYDGAEPSGNSVAALGLLRLAAMTDRSEFKEKAEGTVRLFADRLQRLPQAMPHMLLALDYMLEEPKRAVVVGDLKATATRSLLRAAHSVYQPNKVVLNNAGPVEPFAKTLPLVNGQPAVYLCTGTSCLPPTADAEKMKALLK